MDIPQLKTFVAVAREGSITRASELLHLSQPAVSAHIKALEDALGLALFERTPRGMTLTAGGQRLLIKAEQTLGARQGLMDEAKRIKGGLMGTLRLGAGSNSNEEPMASLLAALSETWPDVEVSVRHGTSQEIVAGIRSGTLDAGFYNEGGEPDPDLAVVEVSRFKTYLAAPPASGGSRALLSPHQTLDWKALGEMSWIYPTSSACCGRTAESLFEAHRIRPKRIVSVDRESVTRSLVAAGVGVGLLHADTAKEAQAAGEVDLVYESPTSVRVLFTSLASRAEDPLVTAAVAIMRGRR